MAIAKYATRGKQYLVMVRPCAEGLLMEQLRYADEVRDFANLPVEKGEVDASELKLAVQLVDQASADEFQAGKYKDEVRDRMLELIQQKVDGEEIVSSVTEEPQTQIIDLMAALKASLADEGEERKPAKKAASRKKSNAKKKVSSG